MTNTHHSQRPSHQLNNNNNKNMKYSRTKYICMCVRQVLHKAVSREGVVFLICMVQQQNYKQKLYFGNSNRYYLTKVYFEKKCIFQALYKKNQNNENSDELEKHHLLTPHPDTHGEMRWTNVQRLPTCRLRLLLNPRLKSGFVMQCSRTKSLEERKKTLPEQKCTQTQDP